MKFKKLVQIILLLSLSVFLTGCGNDNQKPQDDSGVVPSDRQITLIWWNLFESEENIQPLLDAYQAIHPNVTIEYSQKDPADYIENLEQVMTDGQPETTPDIFTVNSKSVGRYKNYTLPAPSEVMTFDDFQSNFYPVVVEENTINDLVQAIPLGVDSLAVIYNKDLLAAQGYSVPSSNWTELFDQAKKLTLKNSQNQVTQYGLSFGPYDNSQFWFGVFNLLLLQSGVEMVNETTSAARFASDEATSDAVSYLKSYQQEAIWTATYKQDISAFLEGKLAMYIAPSWRLLDIITYNETYNLGLNYDVASMPQLTSLEDESIGWADYWTQMVSFDSQNYKVAWDFLNFATLPDQQRLLYQKASEKRAFGQISSRADMKPEFVSNENLSVFVEEVDRARSWFMVSEADVESAFMDWLNSSNNSSQAESEVTSILTSTGYLK